MPLSGAWRVTFSIMSKVEGMESNWVFLYLNGVRVKPSMWSNYSGGSAVGTTSGREWIQEAIAGDAISLWSSKPQGGYYGTLLEVNCCFEFIPKN